MNNERHILNNSKFYVFVFIGMMALLFCMWLIGFIQDYDGEQANIFYQKTQNYNADFFNVAKYAASPNPYLSQDNTMEERAYLPLSYVIMRLFSKMADYQTLSAFDAGFSTISLATSSFAIFLMAALLFLQLYEQKTGGKATKFGVALMIVLSGAFIRAFERGNLILLTITCIIFFIMNYKSEKKLNKELAFIALAIAAALKAYPALLGILLLYEKRWAEAVRLAVYGVILVFVPFLLIDGGFSNIPILLENLKLNSQHYSRLIEGWRFGLHYLLVTILDPELKDQVYSIAKVITYVFFVISLVVAPFMKKLWKKYAVLLLPIIMLPDNSGCYCILYILPFFIMFLNEENHDKRDVVFLVLFLFAFNPYQIPFLSEYAPNASLSLIWIWLICEGVCSTLGRLKSMRNAQTLAQA